ncbi:hypothetical protein CW751_03490 [Brumimicrobium salinarum]|uniref:Uncharacterized protein n=1 Tax=Brumimicrobium salinarum TaxID=2058658 RepID=A0A2I0R4U0_9FLAO|nr:hypothetical protein [Brumimicrobium salinarum]PKR81601.1 hypothetical protein CW751_03490 [Brumimicrobium salinarum]
MKYIISITFIFLIALQIVGQKNYTQLREKEVELNNLLSELRTTKGDEELKKVNEKFKTLFKKTLNIEGAFDFPFKALKTVGKIKSDDELVRVISWNVQYEDLMHDYFAFVMKKDERRNRMYVTELNRKPQHFGMIQHETVTHENWYGALYYDIIDVQRRNRTYYTLLGYDANDQRSSIKLIDVLYFTGKIPNFGYPLFEVQQGRAKRVIFEHSNKATMSLRFDNKRNKIVFDHLTPESPGLKEFREFYVPDMSYDAYEWNGKQWILHEDIIAVNKSKEDQVNLKAYDSEKDTVITIPAKSQWIDPTDPNSPLDGGAHQAVTPDDLNDEKKNKKSTRRKERNTIKTPPSNHKGVSFSNLNGKKKKKKRKKR